MANQNSKLLPTDVLFSLLPAAFDHWGTLDCYSSCPPTAASLGKIQRELNVDIPPLFISVAAACSLYGGWFGSIGDDFTNHNHLININRGFREHGLSERYVMLNHGHDGDCDAWDRERTVTMDEHPIVYFNYDCEDGRMRRLQTMASNFAEYIDKLVRAKAVRCPTKNLRRRAKRILAQYESPADP